MASEQVYVTSHLKRKRRKKNELAGLDDALYRIIEQNNPMTVRQAFYQAEVAGLVPKDETGYNLVQRRLLIMRRAGDLPYSWITDNLRMVQSLNRWNGPEEFANEVSSFYRRDYWQHAPCRVEVWIEKDALASTLYPVVVQEWGLDLYVARGFSSETYLQAAADAIRADGRPTYTYILTDHDPAGLCIAAKVAEQLPLRADDVPVVVERLAVTEEQIEWWNLPTRPNKTTDSRAAKFKKEHGDRACELDAISPDMLRTLVDNAIRRHADTDQVQKLKRIEQLERQTMKSAWGLLKIGIEGTK